MGTGGLKAVLSRATKAGDRGGVTRRWLQLCPRLDITPGAHGTNENPPNSPALQVPHLPKEGKPAL